MDTNNIELRVKQITAEKLDAEEGKITLQSSFVDDLKADSLDLVELVMAFEQEFDCEISEEDAEKIRTVADAINHIQKSLA